MNLRVKKTESEDSLNFSHFGPVGFEPTYDIFAECLFNHFLIFAVCFPNLINSLILLLTVFEHLLFLCATSVYGLFDHSNLVYAKNVF